MNKLLVLNDLHLGVQRSGGTTPESAQKLRDYMMGKYEGLLSLGTHVVINGDFFDTFQVPTSSLLQAYLTTAEWLTAKGEKLYLLPGNHDLSKNSAMISSFELLAHFLMSRFPDKVEYLAGGNWIDEAQGVYGISHVPNQDAFEFELEKVPAGARYLLLHANLDNAFAAEKEHSLNLSREQAKALVKRGLTVIMGHEHQGRTILGDKVVVVGNQYPSSVSDCLAHGDGQKDGHKYCLEINGEDMELIPTWSANDNGGGFDEIDWQDLGQGVLANKMFIRVTGAATAEQSAEVIKVVSKFRQTSNAFVITNAVKVEGVQDTDALAQSVEDIRLVNVVDLLMAQLDPDQQTAVKKLLEQA